jgi:hypothetical protein
MAALLFVAVLSTQIGITDRRSTIRAAHAKNAFACAETALERGRVVVAANWYTRNCGLPRRATAGSLAPRPAPGSRSRAPAPAPAATPTRSASGTTSTSSPATPGSLPTAASTTRSGTTTRR